MDTMKFEHETFDFHGVFICSLGSPDAVARAVKKV